MSQATVEVCNGFDDDCDGLVDDEDSSVSDQGEWDVDRDKDGYGGAQIISCAKPEYPAPVYDEPDCDDSAPAVKPDGHEVCNDGIDQNCDGQDLSCADVDDDSDGWTENQGDCDDKNPQESPEKTGQYCN